MHPDKQELQQKLMVYQFLNQQLEEMRKHATIIQSRFIEIEATRQAVQDLKNVKVGSEALMPLGSGLFMNGAVGKGDFLMDVGAGVMSEKSPAEVLEHLESRKIELEKAGENLQNEMLGTAAKMSELGVELEHAMNPALQK